MDLKNIVWTAVVATVASLAGLVVAILGGSAEVVMALAGIAITSAFLSTRE